MSQKKVRVQEEDKEGGDQSHIPVSNMGETSAKQMIDQMSMAKAKVKAHEEATKVRDSVYFLGPSFRIFHFNVRKRDWEKIKVNEKSQWKG